MEKSESQRNASEKMGMIFGMIDMASKTMPVQNKIVNDLMCKMEQESPAPHLIRLLAVVADIDKRNRLRGKTTIIKKFERMILEIAPDRLTQPFDGASMVIGAARYKTMESK